MDVYSCDTNPDPEKREEPSRLSSVEMHGRWTEHAYIMSHDRQSALFLVPGGFEIRTKGTNTRFGVPLVPNNQGLLWGPDSRKVSFWAPIRPEDDVPESSGMALGVLDVRRITKEMSDAEEPGPPPYDIVYAAPSDHIPFGLEWSPSGKALYVAERFWEDRAMFSRIMRVPYPRGKPTEIARMGGMIDFFMPPVSRFEGGQGPSRAPYWIVFGHPRGLFVVDPKGRYVRPLASLPATGLHNVEWHPGRKDDIALYFRRSMTNKRGEKFKGLYVAHLDRVGKKNSKAVTECLYPRNDVHTLWYSPRGKYISWANKESVFIRPTDESASDGDEPVEPIVLSPTQDESPLEVKGFTWHRNERMLAVAAGNQVLVYDVEKPEQEPMRVASFGREGSHFVAEPVWQGDKIVLTVFENYADEFKGGNTIDVEAVIEEDEGAEGGKAGDGEKKTGGAKTGGAKKGAARAGAGG